jgi:hypothetical protein
MLESLPMDDHLHILRREYEGTEDSFLLRLHANDWDLNAYAKLDRAMLWTCHHYESANQLERWLSEVFYRAASLSADITANPAFHAVATREYYAEAVLRLYLFADWFFSGICSWSTDPPELS